MERLMSNKQANVPGEKSQSEDQRSQNTESA